MDSDSRALIRDRIEALRTEVARAHAMMLAAFDRWQSTPVEATIRPPLPAAVTETTCRAYELLGALCGTLEELTLLDARESIHR
jgi:hypothetical protein